MTRANGVEELVQEWERVRAIVNDLPALEVPDPDEGAIEAGGTAIASVYMADDFPCIDSEAFEHGAVQMQCVAIRDLIVLSVNLLPLLLADWRRMREQNEKLSADTALLNQLDAWLFTCARDFPDVRLGLTLEPTSLVGTPAEKDGPYVVQCTVIGPEDCFTERTGREVLRAVLDAQAQEAHRA